MAQVERPLLPSVRMLSSHCSSASASVGVTSAPAWHRTHADLRGVLCAGPAQHQQVISWSFCHLPVPSARRSGFSQNQIPSPLCTVWQLPLLGGFQSKAAREKINSIPQNCGAQSPILPGPCQIWVFPQQFRSPGWLQLLGRSVARGEEGRVPGRPAVWL